MGRISVLGLSPWEILGLSPGAPPGDIAAAYRRLSFQVHPDMGGSNALMALLVEAREQAQAGGSWGTSEPEPYHSRPFRQPEPARPRTGGWRGGYRWVRKDNGNYSTRMVDRWVTVFQVKGEDAWSWVCEGVFSRVKYIHREDAIDAAIDANAGMFD